MHYVRDQLAAASALTDIGLTSASLIAVMPSVRVFAEQARANDCVPAFDHVRVDETGVWIGVTGQQSEQLLAMVCVYGTYQYKAEVRARSYV